MSAENSHSAKEECRQVLEFLIRGFRGTLAEHPEEWSKIESVLPGSSAANVAIYDAAEQLLKADLAHVGLLLIFGSVSTFCCPACQEQVWSAIMSSKRARTMLRAGLQEVAKRTGRKIEPDPLDPQSFNQSHHAN